MLKSKTKHPNKHPKLKLQTCPSFVSSFSLPSLYFRVFSVVKNVLAELPISLVKYIKMWARSKRVSTACTLCTVCALGIHNLKGNFQLYSTVRVLVVLTCTVRALNIYSSKHNVDHLSFLTKTCMSPPHYVARPWKLKNYLAQSIT